MGMGWDWRFPASLMKPGVVGGVSKWLPPPSPQSPILYSSPLGYERERGFLLMMTMMTILLFLFLLLEFYF